ncbi:hypothetical protein JYU34_007243 [Plutella xylostella]|uniref:DUF5641 domain-containing protein n=1 Tax=Plutella xylostella TaxID=51655 RepID=A0ABQ7QPX1_PLUXY|nr:hypothetical protein JYU34_007243 [Plutella xylostella]
MFSSSDKKSEPSSGNEANSGVNINNLQLKDLNTLRGTKKGALTKFRNYVMPLSTCTVETITSLQIKELTIRLTKIENLFFEFDNIQTRIELLCDDEQQYLERELFESQYYSTVSIAQEIIENYSKFNENKNENHGSNKSTCSAACSGQFNNVKLPTINLPKFDGNYLTWLEYRDTFDSLINSNESISNINKFHYLRASLEGNAAVVIKSIEFTSQNYNVAWELLCERFDNKKILINNHLKAIFNFEPIARESHKALRFMIDHITKNLRSLQSLDLPTDSWDILIIYLMSTKIDPVTLRKWEESKNSHTDLPTLKEFLNFLRNRADVLETMLVSKGEQKTSFTFHKEQKRHEHYHKDSHQQKSKSFVASSNEKHSQPSCPCCNDKHRIVECNKFHNLSPEGRSNEVVKHNLCSNCLRRGHNATECRLSGTCRICKQKHNTLLHRSDNNNVSNTVLNSLPVSLSAQTPSQVLLGTALIKVVNPETKNTYVARALLDAGSQSSFITSNLKHKMGLVGKNINTNVTGINNAPIFLSESCELSIESLVNPFSTYLKCLVMPQITGHIPNVPVDVTQLNLPEHIQLADPNFYQPCEVDLLLGAEVFYELMSPKQIKSRPGMPILQESKLGWIVVGPLTLNNCNLKHNGTQNKIHSNFTKEIHENLTKFWALEEVQSIKQPLCANDEFCEQHFTNTTKRLDNGRFSVLMPLCEDPETSLGDSYKMAEKRFINLEKKLKKCPDLKQQYTNFIKEYEDLGHLTKIERPTFGYMMPHHAVIRESSETSRLRVVFDASAKSSSNKSLNDIQCIGPVVQDDLFSILVRFRQHKYVLSGDITKMYRQISMDESQRHLQLILWRDDDSRPLDTLQLNTVTYGTASAPYLSTRCLVQLAKECRDPVISEVIQKDFYVDDLLTGASTEHELAHIHKNVTETLASACFPIRKFRTNCPQIFSQETETEALNLNKESSVLGITWAPNTDTLKFSININTDTTQTTKRNILSNTCKIFDPLGLLSASTITLKILLQTLWQLKLEWDTPVPKNIEKTWKNLISQLNILLTVSVPRFTLCTSPVVTELHCFVDASQNAYAACVYLRTVNDCNTVTISLLCSKTRVSPLKTVTIPRLELCAALLGARLVARVSEALRCQINKKIFWSDSTITIGWIRTQPKVLKAFVCNRIHEIHELTDRDSWRHVPTEHNPADLASRGVKPSVLVSSSLWWRGPSFLSEAESEWPQTPNIKIDLPELKVNHIRNKQMTDNVINFEKYSNALKLKRVYAYVFRFIKNCKTKARNTEPLNNHELNESLMFLVKMSQRESFSSEIEVLTKGNSLKHKSRILQLSPFLDANGVLRVGGRLENASLNYEQKHPALLDSKHHYTKMLMAAEHLRLFHAGPQLLLSSFREQFWPLAGRNLARSTVRKCITCTRLKGHFLIGRPLTSLPEPPCENMKIRTRYQLIEQYRQSFWSRWSKEYLAETQQRNKCRLKHENLKPGDMVVFKELNLPPMKWKLARVQHMYPGSDGVCRVADFITYRGVERRALNKVCPLPVTADDEDDAETLKEISTSFFQGGQNVNADGNIL